VSIRPDSSTWRRHTTPVDLAVACGFALFAAVETLLVTDAPDSALRAVLAAATMAGLALRRRHALVSALMVAVGLVTESLVTESADEVAVLVGVVLASFSVAAYASTRDTLIGAVVLSMAVSIAISVDPSDSVSNIPPTLLLFVVTPAVIGATVHRKQRDIATLQLEAESLAREAEAAVDAERRRIARELHDVVSHAVTLVAVQAEAGQATLDSDPAATRRSLAAIADVSREALAELDRMLALLREEAPPADEDTGLARVDALVEGARSAGLTVSLRRTGEPRPVPAAVDRCAYRVVQEGLTNALRHSAGGTATVTLHHDPHAVRIDVDTSGRRHRSAYGGTGRGLDGLRERVAALGGRLAAGPTPEGGFSLTAVLPLDVTRPEPTATTVPEPAP
jgi:signal transduction histidine kinase